MIVLSVTTSGDPCSISVSDTCGLLVERTFRHRMQLSEKFVDYVDTLLADAGITLRDVGAFAVDVGPGSFTGVRVGVTAVKMWADLLSKPAIGVTALDALARIWVGVGADVVLSTVRARPGMVYVAGYEGISGRSFRQPTILDCAGLDDLILSCPSKRLIVCGDGSNGFEDTLRAAAAKASIELMFAPKGPLHANRFDEIARERVGIGTTENAFDLLPLYLSPPLIGPPSQKQMVRKK